VEVVHVTILGGFLGLLLGIFLLALLRLVVPGVFPPQGGLHSHYYVGLLPSNPDGTFSRRDYWRMAALAFAAAIGCLLLLAGVGWVLTTPSGPHPVMEQLGGGVLFALGLLAAMCAAAALVQITRALRWRPRRLACDWAPDTGTDMGPE
jgi:hypothetical protein